MRTGNQWCQVSRHCVALCPSQVLRTCSHLAIHSPHLGLVITFLQPSQYKILHCPRSPAHTLVPQLPPRAPSLGGLFPTTISNATLLPRWTPCAWGLSALAPLLPLDSYLTGDQCKACLYPRATSCLPRNSRPVWPKQTGNFIAIQWATTTSSMIRTPALGEGTPFLVCPFLDILPKL